MTVLSGPAVLGPSPYDDAGAVSNHLIPLAPNQFDLGSASRPFRTIYVQSETVTGDETITGNLTVDGRIILTAAASRLVGGATSFAIRNAANSADNLLISNAGLVTTRLGLTATLGDITATNGFIVVNTAGKTVKVKEGANAAMGVTAAMVAGTVTVNTTAIATGDRVFLQAVTPGGTQGVLSYGTIVNGTSFVITSSSNTDTSTVLWWIVKPA